MQTNLILILSLIDVVAAASDVDGDKAFANVRTKVGEFVVENRVPSKSEFDALQAQIAELKDAYTDNPVERFEDPATHIAPAGLKSDVLRTSTKPAAVPTGTTLRDPFAAENSQDPQAELRKQSLEAERGVAYKEGEAALSPSDITAASLKTAGENGTLAPDAKEGDEVETEDGDDTNDDDQEGAGDEGDETGEPDFEGTSDDDLRAYLDERKVTYAHNAGHANLVEKARAAYEAEQAEKAKEGDESGSGE